MIVDVAKAVQIEAEIARRGIRLKGKGAERYGPCPVCGGRDRFSINTRKQVFNCRGCGKGGDVLDLVQHIDRIDFRTAVQALAGTEPRPIAKVHPVAPPLDDSVNIKLALRIWNDASPLSPLAKGYLHSRNIFDLPNDDEALRFHDSCPFEGTRHPCIIGLFSDIHTNEPKAISRTAIPGGKKIGKAMSLGPVGGCAVKIDADENVEYGLAIGEGLESCLAGRQRGFRPCWSLGSSGSIKSFPVLAGIDALTILVDNDRADRNGRQAGQEDALECAQRWTAAGCEVRRVIPRRRGADMADLGDHHHAQR